MTEAEIKNFVELVIEMRKTQKEFFKSRNYTIMQQSKILEKEVDEKAGEILKSFAAPEAQPDLLGAENE